MPIEINLPCKCPHCGEEFELFQSLAQDVLETVQTRLLAADPQAREEGRQTALAAARAAVQENVVQAQTQIETLQQQLIYEQATHAALQATLDQRMQNAMTQAQQQWQSQSNLEIQQRDINPAVRVQSYPETKKDKKNTHMHSCPERNEREQAGENARAGACRSAVVRAATDRLASGRL